MKQSIPQNTTNDFGQEIGYPVGDWSPRNLPPTSPMIGTHCRIAPLDAVAHTADLWRAFHDEPDASDWTYSPPEKPTKIGELEGLLAGYAASADPMFHAITDLATDRVVGWAAYMRIDPVNGAIEVGNIRYAPALQRTRAGTEAMFLMMRRAFDELGYRRYEWKCHSLNAPSRRAALRYGFTFEGIHRQAMVLKGGNRDTAWYSLLDYEWPRAKATFETWMRDDNFDADGRQKRSLSAIRETIQ